MNTRQPPAQAQNSGAPAPPARRAGVSQEHSELTPAATHQLPRGFTDCEIREAAARVALLGADDVWRWRQAAIDAQTSAERIKFERMADAALIAVSRGAKFPLLS